MPQMVDKSQLFFEFCEMIKNKHSRGYSSLFMMGKNEKEQDLGRLFMLDLTLGLRYLIDGFKLNYKCSGSTLNLRYCIIYFFSESRISASNSSTVGPAGAASGSGAFVLL